MIIELTKTETRALKWLLHKGMEITKSDQKYEVFDALSQRLASDGDLADVVGRSEQCAHPRDKREYIGSNMLRCKVCGKEFS